MADQGRGQRRGVGHDLAGVVGERRIGRLPERHGLGGDVVFQRATLRAGEDRLVDHRRVLLTGEDAPAAWATEGLVRGERHDVAVRHRVGVHPSGDEPGYVGGVEHENGADLVGDVAQRGRLDDPRVRRGTGHDHLRAGCSGAVPQLVHVDALVAAGQAVRDEVVEFAAGVHRRAVGEVPTVVEAEAQDGVAGLQECLVDGHVGVRPGVGLDVGVVGTEQGLDPLARQVLDLVHVDVSAVVALSRVALRVLVGQHRTAGLQHGRRGEVLRCDQLQRGVLPLEFVLDVAEELVVTGGGPGHGNRQRFGANVAG